eukprot:1015751-Pleurochrysis_carterae.AAC.1
MHLMRKLFNDVHSLSDDHGNFSVVARSIEADVEEWGRVVEALTIAGAQNKPWNARRHNVLSSRAEDRTLMTGLHTVVDISCTSALHESCVLTRLSPGSGCSRSIRLYTDALNVQALLAVIQSSVRADEALHPFAVDKIIASVCKTLSRCLTPSATASASILH